MIIGCDYDNTWTDHNELHAKVDFIVTGAGWDEWERVHEGENFPVPVFFNPVQNKDLDLLKIVSHKAHVINESGATDYYEDNKDQVNLLRALCKNCKIHLVEEGVEAD